MIEVKIGDEFGDTVYAVRTRADLDHVTRIMAQALDDERKARETGAAKAAEWTRSEGGTYRVRDGRWQTRRDRRDRAVLPPVPVWTMGAKVGPWHLVPAGALRAACKWDVALVDGARVALEKPVEWVCPLCAAVEVGP